MTATYSRINAKNRPPTFKVEPALEPSAEFTAERSLLIGSRELSDSDGAAFLIGRLCEQTASRNRFNWSVWLDATFPHVVLISGKRGSGKSYDLGVISESLLVKEDCDVAFGTAPFAMILFDTQNQFWTLAETQNNVDSSENSWGLGGTELVAPNVLSPKGTEKVAEFESEFAIRPSELSADDWSNLCGLERFSAMGQCLRAARATMRGEFSIEDMIAWLDSNDAANISGEATRDAVKWRLTAQLETDLFDPNADEFASKLAAPHAKTVIQLANLSADLQSVVVAIVMRKLMDVAAPEQRRRKMASIRGEGEVSYSTVAPRIWAMIDEAQIVCPANGSTAATPVIIDYVKRGRDAGLSLVLATQQPSALNSQVISQCDIALIHKLTVDPDIKAATERMPAPNPRNVTRPGRKDSIANVNDLARSLDAGISLVADSETNRAFVNQTRPRITQHGGGEPAL
jgi:uncharacterized protein